MPAEGQEQTEFTLRWCRDPAKAEEVARFFVSHVQPSYISHSELQFDRAVTPDRWSDDLAARVEAQAAGAIAATKPVGTWLALASTCDFLAGLAFVTFVPEARTPYAILEDLLISPEARGQGVGRALVDWVSKACREQGLRRMFLESGLGNHRAHHFFEQQGFKQTSIVMMRDL